MITEKEFEDILENDTMHFFFKNHRNRSKFKYRLYAWKEFIKIVNKSSLTIGSSINSEMVIKNIIKKYKNKILSKCMIRFYRYFFTGLMVNDKVQSYTYELSLLDMYS